MTTYRGNLKMDIQNRQQGPASLYDNQGKRDVPNLRVLAGGKSDSTRMEIRPKKVINAEVTRASDTNFYRGFLPRGIYVETWEILPLGTRLRVNIDIEDLGESFEIEGKVCLVKTENGLNDDLNSGVGIEFCRLTESQENTIARFCEIREPIFYDYEPS